MTYRFYLKKGERHSPERRCGDCAHLCGHVNLWCMSEEAYRRDKTRIPGCFNCDFWEPCPRWDKMGFLSKLSVKLSPFWVGVGWK